MFYTVKMLWPVAASGWCRWSVTENSSAACIFMNLMLVWWTNKSNQPCMLLLRSSSLKAYELSPLLLWDVISRVQPRVFSAAPFSRRSYLRKFQPPFQPFLNAAAFSRISRTADAHRNVWRPTAAALFPTCMPLSRAAPEGVAHRSCKVVLPCKLSQAKICALIAQLCICLQETDYTVSPGQNAFFMQAKYKFLIDNEDA